MHRKHYNIMAARIKARLANVQNESEQLGIALVSLDFIKMAIEDNPQFNPHRFIEASGLVGIINPDGVGVLDDVLTED